MGFRNPFRMSVDKATGVVYLGDYGPDAGTADPHRGPAGHGRRSSASPQPGFYGWPYCSNFNVPYNEYTFPTGPSGAAVQLRRRADEQLAQQHRHHPAASRRARPGCPTAAGRTPPALCCGSWSPMGGPVYNFNAALVSDVKFPASYNGKVFARRVRPPLDQDGHRQRQRRRRHDRAVPVDRHRRSWTWSSARTARSTCSTTAPAGSAATPTRRSTASSTTPARGRAPIAGGQRHPDVSGNAPLAVQFSSAGTTDPDGNPITYAWDFTTNGSTDSTAANPTFTYTANGEYTATLTVRDTDGGSATASVVISVGRPSVTARRCRPTGGCSSSAT